MQFALYCILDGKCKQTITKQLLRKDKETGRKVMLQVNMMNFYILKMMDLYSLKMIRAMLRSVGNTR